MFKLHRCLVEIQPDLICSTAALAIWLADALETGPAYATSLPTHALRLSFLSLFEASENGVAYAAERPYST